MCRYFIVVDDIWSVESWEIIKYAFPMSGGNKIITTSRIKDVARACCSSFSGYVYNVRPLDMVHSRKLFHRRLFKLGEEIPSHLKDASDDILKKCDGLPLAIIAVRNRQVVFPGGQRPQHIVTCTCENIQKTP
jgi:disease resistance protein RPM1